MLRRAWNWFDDLTGISAMLHPLLFHPVPRARKSAWLYVLGSATLIVFLVQIVTGIALSSAYVASSGQAYLTLLFISGSQFGAIVRGIHYFGASAMVILIGIHAIRVYLMASYKYPRQMNWLTGVALLFLTLGMAFTGQLLRWDQNGFWSAVVAAEQAGRTPLIGNWLGHFILAGDTAGGATLSRFFAAHVFFIPALMFLFLGLHLYLVIHNGISEPPQAGRPVDPRTYRVWYQELLARDGEPFWPNAAWRDVVFGFLVVVTIVALAVAIGPAKVGQAPDPTLIGASPKPDWYLLWYYALLSVIPRWSENAVILVAPLLFALALLLLPFAAGRGERSPLRRPWALVIVAAIIITIAYYGRLGARAPWSPRLAAPPLPEAIVGTANGPVAAGALLFYQKGCEFCHTVAGYGGIRGPDLSDAGDRLTSEQITTRIFSGAPNMPSYRGNISAPDLANLIAFLESRHMLPSLPTKQP
ncbi:MAG TPA: cytochrome b N-terminal domain-containing protein [Terriglobales bacterium]|nr:cytochrome b N-terminal domain-containing protein [Terriglobales bacterium]